MLEQILKLISSYIHAKCPCLFHLVTGYYCPGCGGTRAVMALLHGHIIKSFLLHPLVIYALVSGVFLLIKKLRSPGENLEQPTVRVLIVALIIIAVNFIVKNVLLYLGFDALEFLS